MRHRHPWFSRRTSRPLFPFSTASEQRKCSAASDFRLTIGVHRSSGLWFGKSGWEVPRLPLPGFTIFILLIYFLLGWYYVFYIFAVFAKFNMNCIIGKHIYLYLIYLKYPKNSIRPSKLGNSPRKACLTFPFLRNMISRTPCINKKHYYIALELPLKYLRLLVNLSKPL